MWGKKVKYTPVHALRFCTGRTAHRGSRGIALPFRDHGTRRWWGVSVMPRPLFTPGKDPVPILQEAGWAPGPVWTGAENLAPTGIRSPVLPARSYTDYATRPTSSIWSPIDLFGCFACFSCQRPTLPTTCRAEFCSRSAVHDLNKLRSVLQLHFIFCAIVNFAFA